MGRCGSDPDISSRSVFCRFGCGFERRVRECNKGEVPRTMKAQRSSGRGLEKPGRKAPAQEFVRKNPEMWGLRWPFHLNISLLESVIALMLNPLTSQSIWNNSQSKPVDDVRSLGKMGYCTNVIVCLPLLAILVFQLTCWLLFAGYFDAMLTLTICHNFPLHIQFL